MLSQPVRMPVVCQPNDPPVSFLLINPIHIAGFDLLYPAIALDDININSIRPSDRLQLQLSSPLGGKLDLPGILIKRLLHKGLEVILVLDDEIRCHCSNRSVAIMFGRSNRIKPRLRLGLNDYPLWIRPKPKP